MRTAKNKQVINSQPLVSEHVRSYEQDPFFVKKTEAAKETLKRVGVPQIKKK